jgi:hypothetical protein
VTRDDLRRWIADYQRAWRTGGTEPLRTLFAAGGRCTAFEEWPFWPEQSRVADGR